MFVTLRFVGAVAASAIVAMVAGGGVAVTVAANAVLVAVALADAAFAPPPARLAPRRLADPTVTADRESPVRIRLRNPLGRSLRVSIHDASAPSLRRNPMRHRAVLPPRSAVALEAAIAPERRGGFSLGPIAVRTTGPLGIAGRQRTLRDTVEPLKVYPRLPGRADAALRLDRARLLQSGQRATIVRGAGGEFDSLRDYHRDDEFRRINWKATARAGKPISNVYREERNQQIVLLLDAGRTMAGTVAGISRFEHAIDAAMTVADIAAHVGDHVGMVTFAGGVRAAVGPRSGRAQSRRMLDALYALEPTLEAPNFRLAFSTLLTRYRRRSLLVLLTDLAEASALDALLETVPALCARHLVLVGAVTDPAVEREATSMPGDAEQAYAKAAALGALQSRERTAARLRALGATVIDRPPASLPGAIADAYLHIKATGRL